MNSPRKHNCALPNILILPTMICYRTSPQHTEGGTVAFPVQQGLHEKATVLRYSYTTSLGVRDTDLETQDRTKNGQ
jgi:hypothetical protein